MQAIITNQPGDFTITDIPLRELEKDEVLIKVKASGICTNDVRDFKGECSYTFPRIGGHEDCGVIDGIGSEVDPKRFQLGQKVSHYIIDNCQECYYCKRGDENICEEFPKTKIFQNKDGLSGYGGFAEYVIAKAVDICFYPETTPFEKMAFTEPVACVVNSVIRTDIRFGVDVLVIGGGTMGMLHVMLARLKGARVIMSEPLPERREKALKLGCDAVVDPIHEDAVARVKELTGGRGANIVFNTTAIPAIAKVAVAMTCPGGTTMMFSSIHPNEPVPVSMGELHSFQKTITGAVSPSMRAFNEAVLLIGKNLIDPTELTEKVYDYTQFGEAMAAATRPDTYKVILKFGDIG